MEQSSGSELAVIVRAERGVFLGFDRAIYGCAFVAHVGFAMARNTVSAGDRPCC